MAFAMEVLLPFMAVYATPALAQTANSAQTPASQPQGVLICTGQGFQWVQLKDLQPQDTTPQPSKHYSCPACSVSTHVAQALLPFDFLSFLNTPQTASETVEAPGPPSIKKRLLSLGHFSRGPPQA